MIGASLSFGFLGSGSDDVRVIAPIVSVEVNGYPVAMAERTGAGWILNSAGTIEVDGMVVSANHFRWVKVDGGARVSGDLFRADP